MKKIDKEKIKTWFVTGASSGVGYEMCKQLLERGYNVIAVSRRIPDFKGNNALCLSVDVTKPETIKTAMDKGIEKFGRIDVLVNNAGICPDAVVEEETLENLKTTMEINFFGTFNVIKTLLPHFRQNKNGTIINNTSQSGLTPRLYGCSYCSSKHAIEGLTGVCWNETQRFCRVMAFELGWFEGTDIKKTSKSITSKFIEYQNIKDRLCHYYYSFKNDLKLAIKYIIEQVEMEKLPRRLILGKDAYIKVKSEIKWLKKDLNASKNRAMKCAKFDKEFPKKVIKKIKSYIGIC